MPTLKLRGIEAEKVRTVSKNLIDELQQLLQCPREYFSLEAVQAVYIFDGEFVKGWPAVEVYWFERPQEVQDKAAEIITNYIHSIGYENVDVIFTLLDKSRYYENGEHF